ncbi:MULTISPECIES: hypothetical protein [unclassified Bacillus (in: firmicutes)]|uniref:hypothetical protein n=1 Tax=unclassified Bacillus (in: firmicutes) TaxID=185979 RepID=UPI0008E00619|nr:MULTISPECIES: hypothetical protein [unclassified Bacillus (in: firmicutes)]SFB17875.1 hypothetical protein SAMN02799634_107199 [Bacillus sp. UNCCL13]SFQ76548.1 hypothetical protein SAMN04488577_1444 [Bacillus sp. cl95]
MRRITALIFSIVLVGLLGACGPSFKQESKETEKAVKTALEAKIQKQNKKIQSIEFHLPFGFEVKEKSPNNIILKNGSKTYILFYNPHEKSGSEVVYEATKAQHEKIELDKTYKKDDKFAYLLLEQLEEDMNEVTVGIGGTKITTETKTSSMKNEAKTMMEIVSSVKMK